MEAATGQARLSFSPFRDQMFVCYDMRRLQAPCILAIVLHVLGWCMINPVTVSDAFLTQQRSWSQNQQQICCSNHLRRQAGSETQQVCC